MIETEETSRQLKAKKTKREIFDAAMRLLVQSSDFNAITIRGIVKEAGVSIGSFYNYYETKQQVYYETYYIADDYFEEKVRPALVHKTTKEKLHYFFLEYSRYNQDVTPFILTKILYNPENKYFHRQQDHGMMPILTDMLQEGIKRGELTGCDDAAEAAEYIMICMRGIVYDWCISEAGYDLGEKIDSYLDRITASFF